MANGNRSSVDFEVQPRGGRLVDYNKLFRNAVESSLLICDLARRKGHPNSSTRKCWSIWEKGGRASIRFSSLSFYAPSKGLCAILFVDGSCNERICIKYLVPVQYALMDANSTEVLTKLLTLCLIVLCLVVVASTACLDQVVLYGCTVPKQQTRSRTEIL